MDIDLQINGETFYFFIFLLSWQPGNQKNEILLLVQEGKKWSIPSAADQRELVQHVQMPFQIYCVKLLKCMIL